MLSIIADMMITAARQEHNRWPERDLPHETRFTADADRRRAQRNRRHNPYSFFH